jgi:hypothetical protein
MTGIMAGLLGTGKENNMVCLTDLKDKLYELLLTTSDNSDVPVQLDQKLGVSITKAAQKEGNVQIIQLQNANVHQVTEKVVDALKLVDRLETTVLQSVDLPPNNMKLLTDEPISIEPPKDCVLIPKEEAEEPQTYTDAQKDAKIHKEFMEMMYRNGMTWKEMQRYVLSGYLEHVVSSLEGNRAESAKFLKIQRTYISKKIGEFKILGDKNDDNGSGTGKQIRDGDPVSETDSDAN